MKLLAAIFLLTTMCAAQEWRQAARGWQYEFPRDHHSHQDFKTEWWYFTGNVWDKKGGRFGFELTFFRQGVIPPADRRTDGSRFIVHDLKFAHFTVTDVNGSKFHFDQKTSRGAFGEAGFDNGEDIAWVNDWSLRLGSAGEFHLQAKNAEAAIDLLLSPAKPPVVHGEGGVSAKASDQEHASHYYSITRLTALGTLSLKATLTNVSGSAWFDHEWASNQLAPHQVGWNWLCVQLANNTELMLYQMRRDDGSFDPASSGTFIAADGTATHLKSSDFSMVSTGTWKSDRTGAIYPLDWKIRIPSLNLAVKPILKDQELALPPLVYWEGAVNVTDETNKGVGYLELTGYAGSLGALSR